MNRYWKTIQYKADPEDSGGAGAAEKEKVEGNFDILENISTEMSPENIIEKKFLEAELTDEQIKAKADAAEADKIKLPGETTKEEFNEDGTPKTPELKLPESEENDDEPVESTWVELAKQQGMEIKEESFEAYNAALEAKYQVQIDAAKAASAKTDLEKFTPEAREMIAFLNKGGSLNDFTTNPQIKAAEVLLAKSNEDLVREDLKLAKFSETTIETEIANLIAEGQLDERGEAIRAEVQEFIPTIKNNIIKQKEAEYNAERQKEDSLVIDSLSKRTEFNGIPIEAKHLDFVKKQWNDGSIREAMAKDPELAADFALYKFFGKQTAELREKAGYKKGWSEAKGKLHNLPSGAGAGGNSSRTTTGKKSEGGFENLDFGTGR